MTCKVCRHKKRKEIDRMLVDGASLRDIAKQFSVTSAALHRHHAKHIPATLAAAKEATEAANADTLLARIQRLIDDGQDILKRAKQAKEWSAALSAIGQLRGCFELLAKVTGELKAAGSAVNVSFGSHAVLGELTAEDVHAVESHRRYSAMTDEELRTRRKEMLAVIEGSKHSPVPTTVN
jgi:hypothetical protein